MKTNAAEIFCLIAVAIAVGAPLLIIGLFFFFSPDSLKEFPILYRWVYYRYYAFGKDNDTTQYLSRNQVRKYGLLGIFAGMLPIGLAAVVILKSLLG